MYPDILYSYLNISTYKQRYFCVNEREERFKKYL